MTYLTFAQKTLAAYVAADAAFDAADYNTDAAAYDAASAAYKAAYDAAKLVWAATAQAKAAYDALITEIDAANTDNLYLTDETVDHENSCHEAEGSLEFWQAMHRSAREAAGSRAEEAGADINALLGRSIY
jgi:hypothetical protein